MRVVVHPPTLARAPEGAPARVAAVVLAAVRAELRRIDAGVTVDGAGAAGEGRSAAGGEVVAGTTHGAGTADGAGTDRAPGPPGVRVRSPGPALPR